VRRSSPITPPPVADRPDAVGSGQCFDAGTHPLQVRRAQGRLLRPGEAAAYARVLEVDMLEGAELTLLGVGLAALAAWAGWLAVRVGRSR
jgi:hypothetical protein